MDSIIEDIASHEQDICDWEREIADDRRELAMIPKRIETREQWITEGRERIATLKEKINATQNR